MPDAQIRAVITAKDDASSVVAGFTSSLGQMAGAVAIGELAAKALEVALEDVKSVIEDSIKEAAAAEDQNVLLANAIDNMGQKAGLSIQELQKNAMALEDHSKFSHVAIEGIEGVLVRMGDLSGDQVKSATQAIVDIGSATGDLSQAQNALARAFESPTTAAMSLRRAHIYLSESEQDAIKTAAEHGDRVGAQNLIIQAAENHFKNLGEQMQKTGSGPAETFKNKMKDLGETIGTPILNAINPWLDKLDKFLGSDAFKKWLEDVGTGIKRFGEFASTVLMPAINLLVTVFKDLVIPLFERYKKQIEEVAIVLAVIFVGALAGAIVTIAIIVGAIAGMINIIVAVTDWIGKLNKLLVDAFKGIGEWIGKTVSNLWNAAASGFNNFLHNATDWANGLINTIIQIFTSLPGKISGIIGGIGSNALGDIKGALHTAHIPGFASGTTNFSGGLAIVGERGPEIVDIPRGSNVIPNDRITGTNITQSPTINLNVNVGVYAGTEVEKHKVAQELWSSIQDIAAAKNIGVADYLTGAGR